MPEPATTLVLAKLGELGPHHRKSINPCDNRLSPIAAQSLIGGLALRGDRCSGRNTGTRPRILSRGLPGSLCLSELRLPLNWSPSARLQIKLNVFLMGWIGSQKDILA